MALVSNGICYSHPQIWVADHFMGILYRKVRYLLQHRCSGVPNIWSDLIISTKSFG